MKSILLMAILVVLVSLSFASAYLGIGIDKSFEKNIDMPYGKVTLTDQNFFTPDKIIEEIELRYNTQYCNGDCRAEKEITIYKDSALIDNIKFIGDTPKSYQLYIRTSHTPKLVDDYSLVCINTGKKIINITGTFDEKTCSNQKVGSHTEYEDTWEDYSIGEIKSAGTYYVELRGDLGAKAWETKTTDWIITSQGKEIVEWAIWTSNLNVGLTSYYTLNETTGLRNDSLGNYNATCLGGCNITGSSGLIGNSFQGNGTIGLNASYVLNGLGNQMSINLWYKSGVLDCNGGVLCPNIISGLPSNNFSISEGNCAGAGGSKVFRLYFNGQSCQQINANIFDNNWHQIVITATSGGSLKIYVDNVLNVSTTTTNFTGIPGEKYFGWDGGIGIYNNASLDEIGVWNRTLSTDEITSLYNSGAGITYNPYGGTGVIFIENSFTFNASTYETYNESYYLNITYNTTRYPSASAYLVYNGESYAASKTNESFGESGTSIFDRSLLLPLNFLGNKSLYWEVRLNSTYWQNSSTKYQNVLPINLTLCNYASPINTTYLNFTFKDESTDGYIAGQIPTSTFTYWFDDASYNKTLTLINNTGNMNYPFCFTPSNKNITMDIYMQYKNTTSYPQRVYDPSSFSQGNQTLQKILYLLSSTDGIYVTFQVINYADQPIEGVEITITRVIGSETVIVGYDFTNAAGQATFWLNPDFIHTFTFEKENLPTYITSFAPTQSSYPPITMGTGTSLSTTDYTRGVTWNFLPSGDYLEKNIIYSFNYTLASTIYNLDEFGYTLSYSNGTLIDTQSSSASTGGTLNTANINLSSGYQIDMDAYFIINSSRFEIGKSWKIQSSGGDYSIWNFINRFKTYSDANMLGIKGEDGTDNFTLALISLLVVIMVAGGITYRYGIANEAAIMGIVFGIVAFLDVGIDFIPNPVGAIPHFVTIFLGFILLIMVILEESK